MKWMFCCILNLLFCGLLTAQPVAYFLEKEAKVGELIHLSLTLKHDGTQQWVFPDSISKFGAFEWVDKIVFPTKQLSENLFVDSAIYTLRTFEIDTVLQLSTAVVALAEDSIFCESNPIRIIPTSYPAPKNSPLYINTLLYKLDKLFDFKVLGFVCAVLVLAIGVVYVFFGKRIRLYFKLRRLERERVNFLQVFDVLISELPSKATAQQIVSLWKSYCQTLCGLPLSSLTSKETSVVLSKSPWNLESKEILEPLQEIDLAIYAGSISGSFKEKAKTLRNSALEIYNIYLNQIKLNK